MDIAPCDADRVEALVAFVARLNGGSAHHIGYFGTHPADIGQTLAGIWPPLDRGFLLAEQGGQIVGALGHEADIELGRAWLFGPLIDHPDWHTLADRLYAALLPRIPAGAGEQEIFCDAGNQRCQDFAARHGFMLHGEAAILSFIRAQLAGAPAASAQPFDEHLAGALDELHRRLFPRTYLSAQQMIERQGEHARLLVDADDGGLRGYVFAKVAPEAGEGYIDYIGVAEPARGRGVARHLLAAALAWMFSFPTIGRTDLTVTTTNTAALRLYAALGFTQERVMRAYRKRVAG